MSVGNLATSRQDLSFFFFFVFQSALIQQVISLDTVHFSPLISTGLWTSSDVSVVTQEGCVLAAVRAYTLTHAHSSPALRVQLSIAQAQ